MIEYDKYIPHAGIPFVVETSWGEERNAVLDEIMCFYRLTDCTHPMQNCYLHPNEITRWRYIDEQQMLDCNFSENTYRRNKESEKIIESIKITWIDRFYFYLSELREKFNEWNNIKKK